MNNTPKYDTIIIGGGAAGLMAAGTALERGLSVAVIDKNSRPARKVMITGKGRCNVTNNTDIDGVIANIAVNPRFMYGALSRFSPCDTMDFFESLGVKLKTERGNRVFPVSDKACDIVDALAHYAKKADYICGEAVKTARTDDGFMVELSDKSTFVSSSLLIATGGMSYPTTGSTGDGYKFSESFGHTVVNPLPSLIPLVSDDGDCKKLMGLSLKNVRLTVRDNKKDNIIHNDLGEMLFTHFGLSGPLVLSASAHMRPMEKGRFTALIDLKPALSEKQLDARIQRDFSQNINRDFANSLGALLPKKMIPVMIERSGIDAGTKVNQITREQRIKLCENIKNFAVIISGTRPLSEAIITSGGVSVKEINPKTMESKIVPGLYFAGEVIDVDAYTGGYNLQIAFSTGRAAGMNI